EIEFFVQTQQLIFGGKRLRLRGSRTLDMLEELGHEGWVTRDAVIDLRASYLFLREIEHRLQMVADEQTQRLPSEAEALTRFAQFCGYARKSRFSSVMTHRLRLVSHHYGRLFEHTPRLDTSAGSLVFTGTADDPETLETLTTLGFKQAALAAETIRGWHFGRRPAIRGARAREILTELTPLLLQSFARSADSDAALAGFDAALAGMPAAAELFLVLKSNPPICDLFGEILGGAPRLARTIISHPHVLDATIDPNVLKAPLDEAAFLERAGQILQPKADMEEFLDGLRDFAQEELFPIGLRLWSGLIEPATAALAYSGLAASIVDAALQRIERNFAAEHGPVPGGRVCVLALGKLGSREMTATSDLDLILIYDFDPDQPESAGPRPLHAVQYYTRLAQRLVSALTVATRRGRLYEVDMRLRPSGRQGPLATQFSSFSAYQVKDAESWEHMSLTRARLIAGDPRLSALVGETIRAVLRRPRGDGLAREVKEMRAMIAHEKGDGDPWDLKLAAGGLIDIEFIAQYLLLRHAHEEPGLIHVSPPSILAAAANLGHLAEEDVQILLAAYRLFSDLMEMLRLSLDPGSDPRQANQAVKLRLAKLAGVPSLGAVENELAERRAEVRARFDEILSRGHGA
ncbi:MAG: bifunctional [glutamine synthetase] adenylyltransferase/[glutamine synthetase]-adenylyl-L-tyrosine phosphorylase, partial [Alphaproteobacteria bacterium]|nr:bifunctional [glutamine synthetase] adenylyltransferase/[glutamine synthetase]-adenylyl-L-tyrosine phosphorylase [Alphaproteobacteria bacterium]